MLFLLKMHDITQLPNRVTGPVRERNKQNPICPDQWGIFCFAFLFCFVLFFMYLLKYDGGLIVQFINIHYYNYITANATQTGLRCIQTPFLVFVVDFTKKKIAFVRIQGNRKTVGDVNTKMAAAIWTALSFPPWGRRLMAHLAGFPFTHAKCKKRGRMEEGLRKLQWSTQCKNRYCLYCFYTYLASLTQMVKKEEKNRQLSKERKENNGSKG